MGWIGQVSTAVASTIPNMYMRAYYAGEICLSLVRELAYQHLVYSNCIYEFANFRLGNFSDNVDTLYIIRKYNQ